MLRIIFFFILISIITASSTVVLFSGAFLPLGVSGENGFVLLKSYLTNIKLGVQPHDIFMYCMALFLVLNIAFVLTAIIIMSVKLLKLDKVKGFYAYGFWLLASGIVMTGGLGWVYYCHLKTNGAPFAIADFSWFTFVPIGAAVIGLIIALVFYLIDRALVKKRIAGNTPIPF